MELWVKEDMVFISFQTLDMKLEVVKFFPNIGTISSYNFDRVH